MNTKDQALLVSRLYLPLVVREILETPAVPVDMDYTLHQVLSDYRPDSALLAMALSVKMIAEDQFIQTSQLRVLIGACDKMVQDYAPQWLRTFDDKAASEAFILDHMEVLAEDLQSLSDLLKAVVCEVKDEKAQNLFKIFQIQAEAQGVVADEFLNVMECEFMQGEVPATPLSYYDLEEDSYSELDLDIVRYGASPEIVKFPLNA